MSKGRHLRGLALLGVLAMLVAACGGGRSNNNTSNTTSSGKGGNPGTTALVTGTNCTGSPTAGVSGNTIKIGTSLPLSGIYSAFNAILMGESAYFDYVNKELGGVE